MIKQFCYKGSQNHKKLSKKSFAANLERKLHRTKDLKKKDIKLISEGKKLQVGTSRTKNTDQ